MRKTLVATQLYTAEIATLMPSFAWLKATVVYAQLQHGVDQAHDEGLVKLRKLTLTYDSKAMFLTLLKSNSL